MAIWFPEDKKFHKEKVEERKDKIEYMFWEVIDENISIRFELENEYLHKICDLVNGEIIEVDTDALLEEYGWEIPWE